MKMLQTETEIKAMLFLMLFSSATYVSSQVDKSGCGITSSCYSKSARCNSAQDCEYLLKYSVSGQIVTFELSSNKYKWISVGFNPEKKTMAGGESLACETHGNQEIILNHYDMPKRDLPYPSDDVNATVLSSNISGNILYCKIQRKVDLSTIKRTNLSHPVYLLYAAGFMEKDEKTIRFHDFYETGHNLLPVAAISDNTDSSKATKRIDTSFCGKTLGCLRTPSGCHDNTDCNYLLTFNKTDTSIEFSVSGKAEGWVSVGLNAKPKMGGTDAVICQPRGRLVKLSVANLKYSSPDLDNPSEIELLSGIYEGGVIYCKFKRPLKPKSNERISIDSPTYIIYAKGFGSTSLNEHDDDDKGCSMKKVDFESNIFYDLGECGESVLEKVHGAFMIFAWMFSAVFGIFIARYTRSFWKGWKLFRQDVWFQFHRLIMGLSVLTTVIAIVIIVVDKEGWSESAGDHAIFGIIVLVLAIIQPTIAFFRPHPNEPRRAIFNWFHRIVAVLTVVFVVVAVFQGAEHLEDSGGETVNKLIIALIVIAIITALILEYLNFRVWTKKAIDMSGHMQEEMSDASLEVKVQQIMLVVFALVVFILAVVMIAYLAGAGSDNEDDDD